MRHGRKEIRDEGRPRLNPLSHAGYAGSHILVDAVIYDTFKTGLPSARACFTCRALCFVRYALDAVYRKEAERAMHVFLNEMSVCQSHRRVSNRTVVVRIRFWSQEG